MSAQQRPDVVDVLEYARKWVAALNRGDLAGADASFAPDCVIHITGSPVPDLDLAGFKQLLSGFLTAFPDLHFTIEDQLVAGDKVAMRWTAEGTHTGPLGDAPATGRRVHLDGLLLDHVVAGRVAERWEQWDQAAMLRQLGFA